MPFPSASHTLRIERKNFPLRPRSESSTCPASSPPRGEFLLPPKLGVKKPGSTPYLGHIVRAYTCEVRLCHSITHRFVDVGKYFCIACIVTKNQTTNT